MSGSAPTPLTTRPLFCRRTVTSPWLSVEPLIAYTNDALYVVAAAIASAKGRTSSDQILSVLRRLNDSKLTLSVSRSTLLDTARRLAQGDAATLSGATGAIRFQFDGSREPALFEKWTVDTTNKAFVNTPVM